MEQSGVGCRQSVKPMSTGLGMQALCFTLSFVVSLPVLKKQKQSPLKNQLSTPHMVNPMHKHSETFF